MRPYPDANADNWANDVTLERQSDIVEVDEIQRKLTRGIGFAPEVLETATSDTIGGTNLVVDVDASGGARTITLPADPNGESFITVSKADASGNAVTVDGDAYNINGAGTTSLAAQYNSKSFRFIPVAGEWRIVASL